MNVTSRPHYDAIIVGARVAGAATAAFLARAGLRVLLVDRVTFPRPALSCPLYFPNTLHLLDELGLIARVESLGAPRLRLYQAYLGNVLLHGHLLPYAGYDYAYSIRRARFDAAMLHEVAARPGIDTRLGFTVSRLIRDSQGRVQGICGRGERGAEEELRGELVVGADGAFSTVARLAGAIQYDTRPGRTCVFFAYYSKFEQAGGEPSATVYFDTGHHAAFISADSDDGLTVLSVSLPAPSYAEARRNPERVHDHFPKMLPELSDRMRGAKRETPIYAVAPRRAYHRVPFGAGWALVGDAGYYKDPITGQGIYDAVRSAQLLSAAHVRYLSRPSERAWTTNLRRYQSGRDREARAHYWLADYYADIGRFFTPFEVNVFRALAELPGWSDRYVSLFGGVTDPAAFFRTSNILRLYAEWNARRVWRQIPLR